MRCEKDFLEYKIENTMAMFQSTKDIIVRRNCAAALTELFERYLEIV